jgi:hypothetical protein
MRPVAADVRRLILSLKQESRAFIRGLLQISGGLQIAFFFLFASSAVTAEPALDAFYPAGAARGTTNVITALGKFESWPLKVWVNEPGLTFTAETNKGKFSVAIASDTAPGPRLVRLYNDESASEPRAFVIGEGRELADGEPNDHFARAQRVGDLPIAINGRLDKGGDVDSFVIEMRAGEFLEARVDCYTLMSKVDAVLRLVTTNGQQLAWNHDFVTLDPRLVWRAGTNQSVVLQIFGFGHPPDSNIRFAGGEAAVYRLHLGTTNSSPSVCGSATEQEPNEAGGKIREIDLPALVHATIAAADDEDRFQFSAKKNEFIDVRIEAAEFGSPLDAWLKIEDRAGNQIARNDDAEGSRDPRLEWKVPTNGIFIVAIGSLTHRGGGDYCYRLTVQRAEPDYRATLASSSLALIPGATNELKVDIKRLRGFTNGLMAIFRGLPEHVTALTTNLTGKDGAISIRLAAETNAPNSQGPVELFLADTITGKQRIVPAELITRGETGFNHLLIETADQFWLTLRPKAQPAAKAKEK